ncbi:hypothetical protein wHmb_09190 [Wolbachia pipientis]|nr:hypothetical protein wHmb_09190 [Wolbachia pipientis]
MNAVIEIIKCQLPEAIIFIASTYGALELAKSLPFINPIIARLLIKYTTATEIVPSTTALGIVLAGLSTDPAGAVANSTPIKPHRVISVERARICDVVRFDISSLMMKLFLSKKNNAAIGITSNTEIFITVNKNSTRPAVATPLKFISVIIVSNNISKNRCTF